MKLILASLLIISCLTLPYVDQMLLANSMIVGKDDQQDLINWECNVCDGTNKPIHAHYIEESAKDVKCILAVYPTFVVLAFRYTNTLLNVWQDILYANQVVDSNVCSNCKIQKAYKGMWDIIEPHVLTDLKEIKKQTGLETIYITGISLGGGLSVISYIDVKNSGIFKSVNVITFGAPRVANKNYAANFDKLTQNKTKRYIVEGDPIVVLPRCLTLLCNYGHTGRQYSCNEDNGICRGNQPVPESLTEVIVSNLREEPSLGSIVDHIYGYKKIYNHTVVES